MLIGDDYDGATVDGDIQKAWLVNQLVQHPMLKAGAFDTKAPSPTPLVDPVVGEGGIKDSILASEGDFFRGKFGRSANTIVKDLRSKRRVHKGFKEEIDDAISLVRMMKSIEVENLISSISWAPKYSDTIKSLGISERDFESLRKYGEGRGVSLQQACVQWQNANGVISKLASLEGEWDESQRDLWVESIQKRTDAKKMWRNTLHQTDTLSKSEQSWLRAASDLLMSEGPMDSRSLMFHMHDLDARNSGLSTQRLGALLKIYGPEFDVVKNGSRWHKEDAQSDLILKDPWAYTAGFLDADGYITISKRGEPRAGIIATGKRGRVHCEELHKIAECGVLQLDLKVHKSSKRSQHRLQFYSGDDLRKFLSGVLPHLRLKKSQAESVLQLIDLRGRDGDMITTRRDELYKIVKWENWKDVKADELLREWNVDEQEVLSWGRSDPEAILLVDDANRLVGDI